MRVYLVRHGETEYNVKKIVQGHTDIPLNNRGINQATSAAKYFDKVPLDVVYASDLVRASKTAELISGKSPILDKGLREKFMGDAEGLHVSQVQATLHKDLFACGETGPQLAQRMVDTWDRLTSRSRELGHQHVLIVAHGACLRSLIRALTVHKRIDAGNYCESILDPHNLTHFDNCCLSMVADNKLIEYARPLVAAQDADPLVV